MPPLTPCTPLYVPLTTEDPLEVPLDPLEPLCVPLNPWDFLKTPRNPPPPLGVAGFAILAMFKTENGVGLCEKSVNGNLPRYFA